MFSGFSGKACADRIVDSESRVLITMDAYHRAGKLNDHKGKADIAVDGAGKEGFKVEKVLVWRRYPDAYHSETPMKKGRDFFVDEALADYHGKEVAPESMEATETLFLMYTSGTTGKPKGVMLTHGNFTSNVVNALEVLPLGPQDTALSLLPLSHSFERMGGHYAMVHAGVTIAYAESFDRIAANLQEVRPTITLAPPRVFEKFYARVKPQDALERIKRAFSEHAATVK